VRALTSLGLKEAKDLVDGAPKPVLEKVNKETADKARSSSSPPARASRSSRPKVHSREAGAFPPHGGLRPLVMLRLEFPA
jgi:hypothetical protein